MTTDMNNPNNKKWVLLTVVGLLLLMVVLFAACAKPTPTPIPTLAPPATNTPEPAPVVDVNQLYANPWVLVGYGNPDNPTVVESGTAITLQFAPDGQLGGFSGCNNYSGTFQASQDGTMSVSPLAMTMMACAEGMDLESVYLSALQSTRSFTINNEGRLLLSYNDPSQPAQVLIYAIGAKSLTSTTWVLVAYGDPVSSQAVPPDSVITAIFYDDGALSGSSGCNQYAASYTTQDQQLTIGPIGVTQMACPAGMELEQAYLSSLGTAERYEIKGQQLVITYNQGAGVLTYIAANLPLEYTLWTLATLNGQAVSTDTPITAVFTPGEETGTGNISGSSGCNTYNADYTLTGTSITVGPAATTRMACATGMDIEQTYLQALQTSTSYQILADKLVLTNPTGSLTYVANRTQLVGALWKLVALGDVNNPQQPVAGSDFSAQFIRIPGAPSGILNGTTGCNEYTTAFTASLDEMKVNMPVSTNNTSCAPGLSDQEQLYFLALNNATTYHISGNTLTIPYDNGKQALVFEGTQLEEAVRPPLSTLDGTTWYLWYMNNTAVVSGTSIYAQFAINADGASGTLSGSAGCNNYVATFGLDLGVQTSLNATQRCTQPAGIMEQEGTYINMLSRAYGYWLTGDQLIINTGQGVLTYRTTMVPTSYDQTHLLVGKTWYLVTYNQNYSSPGTQEPYTLFNADGTVTGYSGCNNIAGKYSTNIQAITITGLSATQSACPSGELQAQQDAMFAILESAKSYQVVDTVMQLVGDQGVLNYSLTPLNRPEEIKPPQGAINMPAEAFVNQVVNFDGSASTGEVPIVAYKWNFGDGASGTGVNVQHVYAKAGSYDVSLVVVDERGNDDTEIEDITIYASAEPTQAPTQPPTQAPPTAQPTGTPEPTQPPQPTATAVPTEPPVTPPQAVINGSSNGYVGEPISFDASASVAGSSPITSYNWNFGDGSSAGPSENSTISTIYNQGGTYQVTVVVTDENGQSSSADMTVTITTRLGTPVVWVLNTYAGQGVLPGTAITLQFQAGQLAGFSGCNSYKGSYTATDNGDGTYSVSITGLTSTQISCPGDIMAQESAYMSLLASVTGATSSGGMLDLVSPGGDLIFYQAGTLAITPY